MTVPLFSSLALGDLTLPNRVVMAPLTRMRAGDGLSPTPLNATYYAQRASAGLIIAEATQISQQGQGYPGTPGIYSPAQMAGWRGVTEAVHKAGGRIFLQLWHVGRISHSSLQPGGALPVAPSAIACPDGKTFTASWQQVPFETPRALELSEIPALIATYRTAAENAKQAGFDGVEVHSANGYLLDQFLQDGTNKRTDRYGGSIENRSRLLFEVVDEVIQVWGKGRVGVRLSPYGSFNGMSDSNPVALFRHVLEGLSARGIAYAHVIEPRSSSAGAGGPTDTNAPNTAKIFRPYFKGVFVAAGGFDRADALAAVAEGRADAVAFGRLFISNPDLPRRLREDAPMNAYDRSTFYGGTEKGYTDYPFLPAARAAS